MRKPTIDEKTIRDQLKAERSLLFEAFSKNPINTRLAVEIRLIDDLIADLTEASMPIDEVRARAGRLAHCARRPLAQGCKCRNGPNRTIDYGEPA